MNNPLNSEPPGERPTLVATIGAVSIILGWILGFIINNGLYALTYLGLILLFFSYFYYCVNVFEVGGNYQFVALIMILLPTFPSEIYIGHFTTSTSLIFSFLGWLIVCWLLFFVIHHIKKSLKKYILHMAEIPKSPPATGYIILFVLVAFIICTAMISVLNF